MSFLQITADKLTELPPTIKNMLTKLCKHHNFVHHHSQWGILTTFWKETSHQRTSGYFFNAVSHNKLLTLISLPKAEEKVRRLTMLPKARTSNPKPQTQSSLPLKEFVDGSFCTACISLFKWFISSRPTLLWTLSSASDLQEKREGQTPVTVRSVYLAVTKPIDTPWTTTHSNLNECS